jgi:hypothetical protein
LYKYHQISKTFYEKVHTQSLLISLIQDDSRIGSTMLLITEAGTRDTLNQQGLEALPDFDGLTDKDIKNICANAHKPGGTIPNLNAAVANQPVVINNPGVQLGYVYEH